MKFLFYSNNSIIIVVKAGKKEQKFVFVQRLWKDSSYFPFQYAFDDNFDFKT